MKRVVIYKDRVGFSEGPVGDNVIIIRKKNGEILEPLEKIEVSDKDWEKIKKEKDPKKIKKKLRL